MPDLVDDFKNFIDKFPGLELTSSHYQDLIGARSFFYLKMVFSFSESNFGALSPKNRREDIRRFIFGNSQRLPSAEPIVERCYRMYIELSSQDPSHQSVKTGNVDSIYVETVFRRLIDCINSVLFLREQYFTI